MTGERSYTSAELYDLIRTLKDATEIGFAKVHEVMDRRFAAVDQRFDRVEQRLDRVEYRLDGVEPTQWS